ncbi:MAG: LacI family DNA-binding transcriptional regulator [Lachnospiraceae bacterium]|nr:LacI family DNA-binding transcriptional regulator [Lachnospiraceae bacterium]
MVTIKEIADLANVSRGTVDRVLNNRGSVNPQTARKVREIAQTLGYKPNKAGIALAAQKKKLRIGVILFGPENPFFQRVLEGVSAKAEELAAYDCTVLIRRVTFDGDAQVRSMRELVAEGIHGLVMTPYNDQAVIDTINELYNQGIPVVTMNTDIQGSRRIAYVGSNYYEGGRTAGGLMRLATGGHARLGIITGSSQVLCHTERIAGFLDVIGRTAPGIQVLDTLKNHDDEFESYEVTKHFLKAHPDADAIFFAAAGVHGGCRAITHMNRSKQMHVICFDADDTVRPLVAEGLISATISQQPHKQGSRPLDLLFDYLTTGSPPEHEINYVNAAIKIRENL